MSFGLLWFSVFSWGSWVMYILLEKLTTSTWFLIYGETYKSYPVFLIPAISVVITTLFFLMCFVLFILIMTLWHRYTYPPLTGKDTDTEKFGNSPRAKQLVRGQSRVLVKALLSLESSWSQRFLPSWGLWTTLGGARPEYPEIYIPPSPGGASQVVLVVKKCLPMQEM